MNYKIITIKASITCIWVLFSLSCSSGTNNDIIYSIEVAEKNMLEITGLVYEMQHKDVLFEDEYLMDLSRKLKKINGEIKIYVGHVDGKDDEFVLNVVGGVDNRQLGHFLVSKTKDVWRVADIYSD